MDRIIIKNTYKFCFDQAYMINTEQASWKASEPEFADGLLVMRIYIVHHICLFCDINCQQHCGLNTYWCVFGGWTGFLSWNRIELLFYMKTGIFCKILASYEEMTTIYLKGYNLCLSYEKFTNFVLFCKKNIYTYKNMRWRADENILAGKEYFSEFWEMPFSQQPYIFP